MQIFVCKNSKEIGAVVAGEIAALLRKKPDAVLGLPTGSSPVDTYDALVGCYQAGTVSFRDARTFNMDEYIGLAGDHPQSFRYFMEEHLFQHVDIKPENIVFFNGMAGDIHEECFRYDRLLADSGGIDFQLAGIGNNGHLAFNEPGPAFSKTSHIALLTADTRNANKRFFNSLDEVPTHAFTQGMEQICAAKKIVMVATGASKADAVYRMIYGDISPWLPASLLQTAPDVSVYVDRQLADAVLEHFGASL